MGASISKEEYYRIRSESYPHIDEEALTRYRRALRWMGLAQGCAIREVGCKFAILRDLLEEHASSADYKAVDIDEGTLRRIDRYSQEQFIAANVNNGVPFEDESADYFVCLEVMEHLENATFFFSEMARILKPGGRAIISVPNPYCWMELVGNLRASPDSEGHIASYTQQNMDALLKFCGAMILRGVQGTYSHIPFSRRLFGRYKLFESDNIFFSRSYMYLIERA